MSATKGFSAPRQGVAPEAGAAATVTLGSVSTGAAGSSAAITNSGTSSASVFNFTIPRGDKGNQGDPPTLTIGTITTLAAEASATASFTGAALNLGMPVGATGATPTITIGTVSTLTVGSSATASFTGTALNLGIPVGATGDPATATPLASTLPVDLGTAAIGVSTAAARSDHVHTLPIIPVASSSTPIIASTGAAGAGATFARGDHVHPAQTVPSAGAVTPLIAGSAAVGSSAAYAREDHVHPAQSITPALGAPTSRSLNFATAYQATNTAKAALINIIIDCTTTISIGSPQANTVELVIGSANTVAAGTGTIADTFRSDLSVTLISLGFTGRQALQAWIPAGYYFAVRRTIGTGMTIVSAFEQALG